ncbi:MAG: hypothetical protein LBR10_06995, partial [Prevotellaceae bacterium]|nr:hypothetical protein [Prevotellaceae bacterium]
MKTIRQKFNQAIAILLIFGMSSCVSNYYRTTSAIRPDGSCLREIHAKGDSAFLAGDMSHNPYPFRLDSGWNITPYGDSADNAGRYNVKIGKMFRSTDEISGSLQSDGNLEDTRPLFAPAETFRKHFRWFYTRYEFRATYPCVSGKIPAAIDKYMSREEQLAWFRGDFSAYAGMTGFEMKDAMDDMETQFLKWYARNAYEVYFDAVCDFGKLSGNDSSVYQLPALKDTLFQMIVGEKLEEQFDVADIYRMTDKYFRTNRFLNLYEENREQIDALCEEKGRSLDHLFANEIEYEAVVPGRLIAANTQLINRDTPTWRITAMRLVPDDYELTATSRKVNVWAFAVTF